MFKSRRLQSQAISRQNSAQDINWSHYTTDHKGKKIAITSNPENWTQFVHKPVAFKFEHVDGEFKTIGGGKARFDLNLKPGSELPPLKDK